MVAISRAFFPMDMPRRCVPFALPPQPRTACSRRCRNASPVSAPIYLPLTAGADSVRLHSRPRVALDECWLAPAACVASRGVSLLECLSLLPRPLRRLIGCVLLVGLIWFPAQMTPVVMGVIEREAAAIVAPAQRMMQSAIERAAESAAPVGGCARAAPGSRSRSGHGASCGGRHRVRARAHE